MSNIGGEVTLESIREAVRNGEALRRDLLRSLSSLTEVECSDCHRKPTVTASPWGDTLVVCPCMYEAIRRNCKPADPVSYNGAFLDRLFGVRLEVWDPSLESRRKKE